VLLAQTEHAKHSALAVVQPCVVLCSAPIGQRRATHLSKLCMAAATSLHKSAGLL